MKEIHREKDTELPYTLQAHRSPLISSIHQAGSSLNPILLGYYRGFMT